MNYLHASLKAWNTPAFKETLAQEVAQLGVDGLPLQAGLSQGSVALDDELGIMMINASDTPGFITATLGISYSGIVAGCSCADDPTPESRTTEYCQVRLQIDKTTAQSVITLLPEQAE